MYRFSQVIIAVANLLCTTDVHVLLLPRLVPYIRIDQLQGHKRITAQLLQVAAYIPISRSAYNRALQLMLKAPTQGSTFQWRAGDGEPQEMHCWLAAATKTGLLPTLPEAGQRSCEHPPRAADVNQPLSVETGHSLKSAVPNTGASATRRRSMPPPPPTFRESATAAKLSEAVRERVVEEETARIKQQERREGEFCHLALSPQSSMSCVEKCSHGFPLNAFFAGQDPAFPLRQRSFSGSSLTSRASPTVSRSLAWRRSHSRSGVSLLLVPERFRSRSYVVPLLHPEGLKLFASHLDLGNFVFRLRSTLGKNCRSASWRIR